jgi:hypothetical protein
MSYINRREAIKKVALMMGGMIALPDILKAYETPAILNPHFYITPAQEALLAEVAEVIIPTTDTPGAKVAEVHKFIIKVMADCYKKEESDRFFKGLDAIEENTKAKFGKPFVDCTLDQKTDILKAAEASAMQNRKDSNTGDPFFANMKSLTVTGYFTSEIGCTQALRYEPVPGKYIGDMPYKKGDKAWAT